MSIRSRVGTWWRAAFHRSEMSRQVSEELAFHIENYAADLERRGMPPEEAMRRARASCALGRAAEDCRRARWSSRPSESTECWLTPSRGGPARSASAWRSARVHRMVLGMVLREAAWIAAIGMIAGLCAALGLGKLVASMLYGLKSWDPATLIGSALLLGLVALGASWIPARRAASVDPMQALRHE